MNISDPILNGGTDPDSSSRRKGSSTNDPHGGHEYHDHEFKSPKADPPNDPVPGGQGAEQPQNRPLSNGATANVSEANRTSDDLGAQVAGDTAGWPADVEPAIDPGSAEGLRREGMAEGGTGAGSVGPRTRENELDPVPVETLAYTASQTPNLPDNVDHDEARFGEGAGVGQEPVERRANTMVFDEQVGNFVVIEYEHGTNVTSQDHTPS